MARKLAQTQPANGSPDLNTTDINATHIAALAYEFWLGRGCPFGSPEVDWFRAEELLRTRAKSTAEPMLSMAAASGT